ncbi:hypothetical protein GCM10007092_02440 [Thermus composti]|uniref:Transposase n=1 Tax=Thermus composti TaxID=532059 RepID=A0ABV6PYA9_9DEIN|nr:hypothetical protein [Thermus composti]GGM92792.1 hypothetical protein GCM10007092_02440 [Thermus composti]
MTHGESLNRAIRERLASHPRRLRGRGRREVGWVVLDASFLLPGVSLRFLEA